MNQLKLNKQYGFTLVELMMVLALLPMLFLALFATSQAAGDAMRSQTVVQVLNHDGMQMLRSITRELSQTNPISADAQLFITDGSPNDQVRFRIPVDWDGDGDVTGSAEDVFEWGAGSPCNTTQGVNPCAAPHSTWALWKDYWIQYRVASGVLYREVLNASLTVVSGYQQPIAKNISSFQVTQDGNLVTVTVSFTEQDKVGQYGQARNYSQTYVLTTQTMMRNVVDAE